MESAGTGNRHRDPLPSINHLDFARIKTEGPEHHRTSSIPGPRASDMTLVSPNTMHPGPPPPYSYPSSTASSGPGVSGYISPPDSRRTYEEDKEHKAHRQSLPSIHEALGSEKALPYTAPVPTSHPQPVHTPAGSAIPHRSQAETGPPGPPNPFSHGLRENPYSHIRAPTEPPRGPPSAPPPPPDARASGFQSLNGPRSPPQHGSAPSQQYSSAHYTPAYEYHSKAPPPSSPNYSTPYQDHYTYASQPQPAPAGYAPAPYDRTYPGSWKPDPNQDKRAVPRAPGAVPPHTESIKRQLDVYDIEASLNEVSEGSHRLLEFARIYGARGHQTDRTGPVPGSTPSIIELDDLVKASHRVTDTLVRMRGILINQQHALAEQRAMTQSYEGAYDEDNGYNDEYKGANSFAGGDSKKRRGKAAPPGRCHSCNRAETPEWRRGPDGARTLCNACGLHYAKLTRKLGAKGANMAGSNLRPKNGME